MRTGLAAVSSQPDICMGRSEMSASRRRQSINLINKSLNKGEGPIKFVNLIWSALPLSILGLRNYLKLGR